MTDEQTQYSFILRTPEMQARAERRHRIKRVGLVTALIAALLTPATVDEAAPQACNHVWVC